LDKEFINVDDIGNVNFFNKTVIDWSKNINIEKLFEEMAKKISQRGYNEYIS